MNKQEKLERLEQEYEAQRNAILTHELLTPKQGERVQHCVKRGNEWVDLSSPAMQVNPELERLKKKHYQNKKALFAL